MQYENFDGLPWVAMSWRPGHPPPTFIRMRRMARPMVALARNPGPKRPDPECNPTVRAIGPLTMTSGATGCVVAWTPKRLNSGSSIASAAATITGNAKGSHPAITAFTASFRTVQSRQRGAIRPSDLAPSAPPSIARTRSAVGAMIGSPSHHSRLTNSA